MSMASEVTRETVTVTATTPLALVVPMISPDSRDKELAMLQRD